jgi:hypothetical protein
MAKGGKPSNATMNINLIKETIKGRKGANLSVVIVKPLKTKRVHAGNVVEKKTNLVIRGGVEYDNLSVVKEGREDGSLPDQNQGLPWGEWAEYPLHITHKGSDYARFYPASGIQFPVTTSYFLNGVEVSKDAVKDLCLSSEFPTHKDEPLCYTIKAENVRDIIL